jgi:cytochrome c biogenesis protein
MRTALLLLFLLAVAAVPGSVLPQRGLNPLVVDDYFTAHPRLAPILDKFSLFDVFAAPWFAAIYLLLFVSLVGCLVPRIRLHARALRRRPPAAPRHLDRLPEHAAYAVSAEPHAAAERVRARLGGQRWRTVVRDEPDGAVAISAEKGYLRETGNLAFHVALVALLAGIAAGGLWGWKGTVIVPEGDGFCDTVNQYDQFSPGRLVDGTHLPAFCMDLADFTATYRSTGEPASFTATVRYDDGTGAAQHTANVAVNHPLRHLGTRTYLIAHGYAPRVTVTTPRGQRFTTTTPFLPADSNFTSDGVVKLPDAKPTQIGIDGVFTPTRAAGDRFGLSSAFPAARDPALSVVVYEGDLGQDSGAPQSVYALDQHQIATGRLAVATAKGGAKARAVLTPGRSLTLADGTTVRFDGYVEWASLQVSRDPGQLLVGVAGAAMVLGLLLSLRVRRRRLWVRFAPAGEDGSPAAGAAVGRRTVVTAGGLARTDSDTFTTEFARVVEDLRGREG